MAKDFETPNGDIFSELQDIIEEELGELAPRNRLKSAFRPMTPGLGLEPPIKGPVIETEKDVDQSLKDQSLWKPAEPPVSKPVSPKKERIQAPIPEPENRLQQALSPEKNQAPPPIPRPSILRRMLAAMMDQIFVFTLWLMAMVITLRLLTGSFLGLSSADATVIGEPQFIRFAILEFVSLWVGYFILCLGILDMTFGMWIWGIRVGYGTGLKRAPMGKKTIRALLSTVFYAPILPSVLLLVVSRKGQNLLDYLSGTTVYKTAS